MRLVIATREDPQLSLARLRVRGHLTEVRANLFIIPLDNERRWYRYHHLFTDLLRQRLQQSIASSPGDEGRDVAELHRRASVWYEDHGLSIEAFQHAAAAHDVERAERLMEGKGMPLHFRGAVAPVLHWLESLPRAVLDARPWLWVRYASLLLVNGQATGLEEKLQAAEAALQGSEADDQLYLAAETYRHALHLLGEQPLPVACEAHLGLARICYEWNDLDEAWQHAQQGLHLARQFDRVVDRFVICEVLLARLKLAQGDVAGAASTSSVTRWHSPRRPASFVSL